MLIIEKQTLKEEIQSRRCEYMPGVAFWVRPLLVTILNDFRKQCTKTKLEFNPSTKKMEVVEEVDAKQLEDLITDWVIDKWEGVGTLGDDKKAMPLTVNLTSKYWVMNQVVLRDFIWASARNLDTTEAEVKNS